jgi:hypothetical protein
MRRFHIRVETDVEYQKAVKGQILRRNRLSQSRIRCEICRQNMNIEVIDDLPTPLACLPGVGVRLPS